MLADAARALAVEITGAALIRRDSQGGYHVGPDREVAPRMPEHVLRLADAIVGVGDPVQALRPGQTALVLTVSTAAPARLDALLVQMRHADLGAAWVELRDAS